MPDGSLPDDAMAECPWCRETFPLAELVGKMPPALKVISADGEVISDAGAPFGALDRSAGAASSGSAHAVDAGGLELMEESDAAWELDDASAADESQPVADDEANPGFQLDDDWTGPAEATPTRVEPITEARPRRKRKSSSLRTLVGVALGPLIALPLAGVILLALGKAPDLGFYPFDGNYGRQAAVRRTSPPVLPRPEVADVEPDVPQGHSLAPDLPDPNDQQAPSAQDQALNAIIGDSESAGIAEMGAAEVDTMESGPVESGAADSAPSGGDAAVASASDGAEAILEPPTDEAALAPSAQAAPPRQADEALLNGTPIAEPSGENIELAPIEEDVDEAVVAESSPTDPSLANPLASDDAESAPSMDAVGDEATGTGTSADMDDGGLNVGEPLSTAADEAMAWFDRLDGLSASDPRWSATLAKTYQAVAKVAELAAEGDSSEAGRIIDRLKESGLAEKFGAAAPNWLRLDAAKRQTDGIVMVGQFSDLASDQPTFRIPNGNQIPVQVTGGEAPPASQTVLALGRIIEQPNGQLVEVSAVQPLD